jgi:hypothetical protein
MREDRGRYLLGEDTSLPEAHRTKSPPIKEAWSITDTLCSKMMNYPVIDSTDIVPKPYGPVVDGT